ncbi:conserved hypothetical protein [Roseovarius sp. EC-HK134]|nr:conserved hypothetical protein [Roseovarius sp. EC-HK134]VVT33746.1 conserved hypothetical protein [Roseovarius sp. EC-SD190]
MPSRKDTLHMVAPYLGQTFNSLDVLDRSLADRNVRAPLRRGRYPTMMTAYDIALLAMVSVSSKSVKDVAADVSEVTNLPLRSGLRESRDYDQLVAGVEYTQDGPRLTPQGILEGSMFQLYPRDILPMAASFGQSLALLIEHLPDVKNLDANEFSIEIRWAPISAYIQFKHERYRYRLLFGAEGGQNRMMPVRSVTYRLPLMQRLAEIYRMTTIPADWKPDESIPESKG